MHHPLDPVPPEFWPAVTRRLDAVDRAAAAPRRPAPALRAAAAALLALVLLAGAYAAVRIWRRAPVRPERVAAWHQQPLEPPRGGGRSPAVMLSSSPNEAAAWLSRQLGRDVPPIDLELVGLQLRGGLAGQESGRRVGLLRYRRGAERWSLLVIPGGGGVTGSRELFAGRQPLQVTGSGGDQMAAWHSRGNLFVLAGPGPESELQRVARQAARACEIER